MGCARASARAAARGHPHRRPLEPRADRLRRPPNRAPAGAVRAHPASAPALAPRWTASSTRCARVDCCARSSCSLRSSPRPSRRSPSTWPRSAQEDIARVVAGIGGQRAAGGRDGTGAIARRARARGGCARRGARRVRVAGRRRPAASSSWRRSRRASSSTRRSLALPIEDSAEAAVQALDSGMLVERERRIGFRHALLREAAYFELPQPRRAALHERWAQTLLELRVGRRGPSRAAEVARHLRLAGKDHAGRRAARPRGRRRAGGRRADRGRRLSRGGRLDGGRQRRAVARARRGAGVARAAHRRRARVRARQGADCRRAARARTRMAARRALVSRADLRAGDGPRVLPRGARRCWTRRTRTCCESGARRSPRSPGRRRSPAASRRPSGCWWRCTSSPPEHTPMTCRSTTWPTPARWR